MPRNARIDPGPYRADIESFALTLAVAGRSDRTQEMYSDAVVALAGWLLITHPEMDGWGQVRREHLQEYFLWLYAEGYAKSTVNNYGRCAQQFFSWWSTEEEQPNPFAKLTPPAAPKPGEKLVPVLPSAQLAALIKDAESRRDFESRRDAALLRLFACTGCRLAELTGIKLADVDLRNRVATVVGKGNKPRVVKFDEKCSLALDRYIRVRSRHPAAHLDALWIGIRRRMPMTRSGIRQVLERRGAKLGIHVHPHLFRHTFSHNWLDAGGAEGDLMELNGWDSPQMLRHYGASARAARARRAYDRVNVMGGV